ncbi:MAG: MlaD family protein [Planctomycetia bacterium]|nr:MlaD family protein [Planctomycetia bacterium]
MANRRMEFFIGMTVLGIFIGLVIMTIIFGPKEGLFIRNTGKTMTIYFEKAGGIKPNSPVKKNGIEIGRVNEITLLDEADESKVEVRFSLNADAKIYTNEYARVERSLFGDASIDFVKNANYQGEIVEVDADIPITGQPGGDLSATVSNIEGDLAKAIQSVTHAAEGLTLFMGNLNDFLGTPEELQLKKNRLQTIFTELNGTLVSIRSLATNMDGVFKDEELQKNIRKTAADIPAILGKVDQLMANANSLTDDFRITMNRSHRTLELVETNLDNIGQFTTSLSEQGPEFLTSINESSTEIQKMVKNIAHLAEEIANEIDDPSTPIGMLGDKEMASSLRNIVNNAEEISEKIQPIVDDARVFSNKIAHKPSELIWSKTAYKGTPSTQSATQKSSSNFGFQPYSPGGGLSSSLYQPTSANSLDVAPLQYQPLADTEIMSLETQNAYFNAYPDAKSTKSWFKNLKDHCWLFNKSSQTTTDNSIQFPVYSNEISYEDSDQSNFLMNPYPVDSYSNANYSGQINPVFSGKMANSSFESEGNLWNETNSASSSKMKFSLADKMKNLFFWKKKDENWDSVPQVILKENEYPNVQWNPMQNGASFLLNENYEETGLSFESNHFPMQNEDFLLQENSSLKTPDFVESLPLSINRPNNQNNSGIQPANNGYDPNPIPLGPLSKKYSETYSSQKINPETTNSTKSEKMEQLPSFINRVVPQSGSMPAASSSSNGVSTNSPVPLKLQFEDDGLPGQYVPAL